MAKKRELNELRQVKDSVYKKPKSNLDGVHHNGGIDLFIEDMVKQHPNYYSLGQAIHRYYLENQKSK